MVNRILIRIKVVQLLYSYLLTRSDFKIITEPGDSSADKKFAYATYLDLLALLLLLTGNNVFSHKSNKITEKKLLASSVGKAFAADSRLKEIFFKNHDKFEYLIPLVETLQREVTSSSVFQEYRRKRKIELEEEVSLWITLFETTIASSLELEASLRKLPGYSKVGFERAIDMTVETLKSFYAAKAGYFQALKALERSMEQAYKLYLSVFVLIVRLTEAREVQLENAKNKFLATSEDKNPNTRFINNSFARALSESKELQFLIKEYGSATWTDDILLLNSLLNSIVNSSVYKSYMEASTTDWNKDCEFWRDLLKNVIFPSDIIMDAMEEESVYWNDDLHIIGTFVLKSVRIDAQNPAGELNFLPQYKDEEDSRFGAELFEFAVKNREKYYSYIDGFVDTSSWESDRIAFMDTVIMICALAEIINFPNIPIAVSLNEYIDIANFYSSSKSGHFINGVLYSIIEHLKSENIIFKQ